MKNKIKELEVQLKAARDHNGKLHAERIQYLQKHVSKLFESIAGISNYKLVVDINNLRYVHPKSNRDVFSIHVHQSFSNFVFDEVSLSYGSCGCKEGDVPELTRLAVIGRVAEAICIGVFPKELRAIYQKAFQAYKEDSMDEYNLESNLNLARKLAKDREFEEFMVAGKEFKFKKAQPIPINDIESLNVDKIKVLKVNPKTVTIQMFRSGQVVYDQPMLLFYAKRLHQLLAQGVL